MSVTREDVIRYIEGLSSDELGELVEELQRRLGLPPLAAPRPTFRLDGAALVPPWDGDGWALRLENPGADRIQVIRLVRERLGLGLSEARTRVDQAPCYLMEDRPREEVEAFALALGQSGAVVSVKHAR